MTHPTPPNTELAEAIAAHDGTSRDNDMDYFYEHLDVVVDAARCHLATLREDKGGVFVIEYRTKEAAGYNEWDMVEVTKEVYNSSDRDIKEYIESVYVGTQALHDNYRGIDIRKKAALKNPSDAGGDGLRAAINLIQCLVVNDWNDDAADGVSVGMVWQKEAKEFLDIYDPEYETCNVCQGTGHRYDGASCWKCDPLQLEPAKSVYMTIDHAKLNAEIDCCIKNRNLIRVVKDEHGRYDGEYIYFEGDRPEGTKYPHDDVAPNYIRDLSTPRAHREDVSGEEQDNFNSAECIHGIHPDQCVTCTPAPIDAEKALDLLQARAYSHAEKSNAPKEMREWIDRDTETIRAALKKGG